MQTARQTIGHYCFKQSIMKILNKCGWSTIQQMIITSSTIFIHKIITNNKPKALTSLLNLRNNNKKFKEMCYKILSNLQSQSGIIEKLTNIQEYRHV